MSINPLDTFPVVRIFDAAIDHAASDLAAYAHERDVSKLAFLEGQTPTIFYVRTLTLSERREVRNKATDGDRYEAAFARGLVRVASLQYPDGGVRDWVRNDGAKPKPLGDAALEYFSEADVQEIGLVVLARSFLPRGSAVSLPLPATSQHALTALFLHRAGQTKDSASSDATRHEVAAPLPAAPTSSLAGDASTGATATG